jgi:hypothetical protein
MVDNQSMIILKACLLLSIFRTSKENCDELVDEVFEELIAEEDDSMYIYLGIECVTKVVKISHLNQGLNMGPIAC